MKLEKMIFETRVKTVPQEITEGSLWRMEAYRLSLFAAEIGWHDVTRLMSDRRTMEMARQMHRSVGSIEANISEGCSRGSAKDRARFYEYALGSARESRGWYYKVRHVLGEPVVDHHIQLITEIMSLLLAMVPDQRTYGSLLPEVDTEHHSESLNPGTEGISPYLLTNNVPMP